jgi:hypothetical protein
MTHRFGVFATTGGWVVADKRQTRMFGSRVDAIDAARRQAGVARWRGAETEIIAQDRPGGALAVVETAGCLPVRPVTQG